MQSLKKIHAWAQMQVPLWTPLTKLFGSAHEHRILGSYCFHLLISILTLKYHLCQMSLQIEYILGSALQFLCCFFCLLSCNVDRKDLTTSVLPVSTANFSCSVIFYVSKPVYIQLYIQFLLKLP